MQHYRLSENFVDSSLAWHWISLGVLWRPRFEYKTQQTRTQFLGMKDGLLLVWIAFFKSSRVACSSFKTKIKLLETAITLHIETCRMNKKEHSLLNQSSWNRSKRSRHKSSRYKTPINIVYSKVKNHRETQHAQCNSFVSTKFLQHQLPESLIITDCEK